MKTEENVRLEINRVIKVPRDRVYAAWTDPAQLKAWFGPENVQTHDLVADARGYSATTVEFQITRWLALLSSVSTIGRESINLRVSKDY